MKSFNNYKSQNIINTRAVFVSALMLITVLIFNGCVPEQPVGPESNQESTVNLEKGKPKFNVLLNGTNEVPGPGDPDGSGLAKITVKEKMGMIYYEITVSNISAATAAHIHSAPAGQSGSVVVTLTPPDASGFSSGTVSNLDPNLLKSIKENPANYYVNVHNADYPAGAVRGQLK